MTLAPRRQEGPIKTSTNILNSTGLGLVYHARWEQHFEGRDLQSIYQLSQRCTMRFDLPCLLVKAPGEKRSSIDTSTLSMFHCASLSTCIPALAQKRRACNYHSATSQSQNRDPSIIHTDISTNESDMSRQNRSLHNDPPIV